MADYELLQAERDAVAFLGVLAHAYVTWDPPIPAGVDGSGKPDFTHFAGLNIQAMVVDNVDGEALALAKNAIHQTESPVSHAEQAAIRAALDRIKQKRPRAEGTTVESHYRKRLFYEPGKDDEDFVRKGCTLYTSLEPCPMCASTLLVCRMKRTVYVLNDTKFGGGFATLRELYKSYDVSCAQLALLKGSPVVDLAKTLHGSLMAEIAKWRMQGVQNTWLLDQVHSLLQEAMNLLRGIVVEDFRSQDADLANVARTLSDVKRICRLP